MSLLEHTASIAKSLPRYDNSDTSYDMVDVETSDIRIHRRSIASEDLLSSYSATRDGDLEESYNL